MLLIGLFWMLMACPVYAQSEADLELLNNSMLQWMHQYKIPGAAVVVINDGQSSMYTFGGTTRSGPTKVNPQTIFEVGSITKLMTVLLLAEAVNRNEMQLSDPIIKYLPDLSNNDFFKQVTLEQLATHTAGLPLGAPADVKTPEQLQAYLLQFKATRSTNVTWQYSNLGIGLIGLALQKKYDEDINQLYIENILQPLNMQPLGVSLTGGAGANMAQGYTAGGDPAAMTLGTLFPSAGELKASIVDMENFLSAAIGLYGTPSDIQRAMQLTQTPRVQLDDMQQGMGWQLYALDNKNQLLNASSQMNMGPLSGQWLSDNQKQFNANTLIDKTGATDGFRAYIGLIPGQRSGIVILANHYVDNGAIVNLGRKILLNLDKDT